MRISVWRDEIGAKGLERWGEGGEVGMRRGVHSTTPGSLGDQRRETSYITRKNVSVFNFTVVALKIKYIYILIPIMLRWRSEMCDSPLRKYQHHHLQSLSQAHLYIASISICKGVNNYIYVCGAFDIYFF